MEGKIGRHYLVHGQHICPLAATGFSRLQVHGQLQLFTFGLQSYLMQHHSYVTEKKALGAKILRVTHPLDVCTGNSVFSFLLEKKNVLLAKYELSLCISLACGIRRNWHHCDQIRLASLEGFVQTSGIDIWDACESQSNFSQTLPTSKPLQDTSLQLRGKKLWCFYDKITGIVM